MVPLGDVISPRTERSPHTMSAPRKACTRPKYPPQNGKNTTRPGGFVKLTMRLMNFKASCAFSKVACLDRAVTSTPTVPHARLSTRLKIVPTCYGGVAYCQGQGVCSVDGTPSTQYLSQTGPKMKSMAVWSMFVQSVLVTSKTSPVLPTLDEFSGSPECTSRMRCPQAGTA